jgi:hypothetical protein
MRLWDVGGGGARSGLCTAERWPVADSRIAVPKEQSDVAVSA